MGPAMDCTSKRCSTAAVAPKARTRPSASTNTWLARRATSSMAWLTYRVGMPNWVGSASKYGRMSALRAVSNAASGSSSSNSAGFVNSVRANATRCRSPPERPLGRRRNRAAKSNAATTSSKVGAPLRARRAA